jgi:hypothetical protein
MGHPDRQRYENRVHQKSAELRLIALPFNPPVGLLLAGGT